ncbi:MAG: tetratricopeptide repeat protein, partial [Flavobacteriales bacterium]|nr:tetratricopeptide repeat protein [Flavobacteriales bacterium]
MRTHFIALLVMFMLSPESAPCQQAVDSIWAVWRNPNTPDTARIQAMESIAWDGYMFSDPDSAFVVAGLGYDLAKERDLLKYMAACRNAQGVSLGVQHRYRESIPYFEEVVDIARQLGDSARLSKGLINIGTAYMRVSDHPPALDHFFKALIIAEARRDDRGMTHVLINIGIIYREIGDLENARIYFEKGLEVTERSGELVQRSYCLGNLGHVYKELGEPDKAIAVYRSCLGISTDQKNAYSIPRALSSIGTIHLSTGQLDSAWHYFQLALPLSIELDDPEQLSGLYAGMARYHRATGDHERSARLCQQIYERVREHGMLEERSMLCECLYLSYKGQGDLRKALLFHEEWSQLTDSLNDIETSKKVQKLEFAKVQLADSLEQVRVVEAKDLQLETQLADLRSQRIGLAAAGGGVLLLGLLAYSIRRGKKRSDELLLNILPEEVAEELKAKGEAEAVQIDQVTVLFTDFKGFTTLSEKLSPKELVSDLNECFSAFDRITEKHGIEKIKTIGDAYMAAGGLPTPNTTHATDVIAAALEIRDFIAEGKARKIAAGLPFFEIRIGIHTGPVVAG